MAGSPAAPTVGDGDADETMADPSKRSVPGHRGWATAAHYLLLATLLFAFLGSFRPAATPLHHDTSRDLCAAFDSLASGNGPLVGAPASLRGLHQGGLWLVHLALVHQLGGDVDAAAALTFGLLLLALLALAALGEQLVGRASGMAASLLAALFLGLAPESWTVQWNPSLLLLPAVLTLALVLAALRWHSPWIGWLAAAALGWVTQLHPAAWMLVPLVVLPLVALPPRTRRPTGFWVAFALLAALPFVLFSGESLLLAIRGMEGTGFRLAGGAVALPTLPLCGLALAAAGLHAARGGARSPTDRGLAVVLSLWAGLPALFFLGAGLVTGNAPSPRHLLPYLPAATLVLASAPGNLLRLWRSVPGILEARTTGARLVRWSLPLILLGPALLLAASRPPSPARVGTYAEVEALLPELRTRGICTLEDAAARVHSPRSWLLLSALDAAFRLPAEGGCASLGVDAAPLLVLHLPLAVLADLPESWSVVSDDGSEGLLVAPQSAAVDWRSFPVRTIPTGRDAAHRLDGPRTQPGYPATVGGGFAVADGCQELTLTVSPPADRALFLAALPQLDAPDFAASLVEVEGLAVLARGESWASLAPGSATPPGRVTFRWCATNARIPTILVEGVPPVVAAEGVDGLEIQARLTAAGRLR